MLNRLLRAIIGRRVTTPEPKLREVTPDFLKYRKINYGCGYDKREGHLNVDVDPECSPDFLIPPGDLSGLPKAHFDEVYAKDVLEHLPRNGSLGLLIEFASLLRPGGQLILQTTSVLHVARMLEANPEFNQQFGWTICLFGNQAHPGDFHFTGFTERTLHVHLAAAGFEIRASELVDGWMMKVDCVKRESWDAGMDAGSDLEFVDRSYRKFLDRDSDESGRQHFLQRLAQGDPRRDILRAIASSPERLFVKARQLGL